MSQYHQRGGGARDEDAPRRSGCRLLMMNIRARAEPLGVAARLVVIAGAFVALDTMSALHWHRHWIPNVPNNSSSISSITTDTPPPATQMLGALVLIAFDGVDGSLGATVRRAYDVVAGSIYAAVVSSIAIAAAGSYHPAVAAVYFVTLAIAGGVAAYSPAPVAAKQASLALLAASLSRAATGALTKSTIADAAFGWRLVAVALLAAALALFAAFIPLIFCSICDGRAVYRIRAAMQAEIADHARIIAAAAAAAADPEPNSSTDDDGNDNDDDEDHASTTQQRDDTTPRRKRTAKHFSAVARVYARRRAAVAASEADARMWTRAAEVRRLLGCASMEPRVPNAMRQLRWLAGALDAARWPLSAAVADACVSESAARALVLARVGEARGEPSAAHMLAMHPVIDENVPDSCLCRLPVAFHDTVELSPTVSHLLASVWQANLTLLASAGCAIDDDVPIPLAPWVRIATSWTSTEAPYTPQPNPPSPEASSEEAASTAMTQSPSFCQRMTREGARQQLQEACKALDGANAEGAPSGAAFRLSLLLYARTILAGLNTARATSFLTTHGTTSAHVKRGRGPCACIRGSAELWMQHFGRGWDGFAGAVAWMVKTAYGMLKWWVDRMAGRHTETSPCNSRVSVSGGGGVGRRNNSATITPNRSLGVSHARLWHAVRIGGAVTCASLLGCFVPGPGQASALAPIFVGFILIGNAEERPRKVNEQDDDAPAPLRGSASPPFAPQPRYGPLADRSLAFAPPSNAATIDRVAGVLLAAGVPGVLHALCFFGNGNLHAPVRTAIFASTLVIWLTMLQYIQVAARDCFHPTSIRVLQADAPGTDSTRRKGKEGALLGDASFRLLYAGEAALVASPLSLSILAWDATRIPPSLALAAQAVLAALTMSVAELLIRRRASDLWRRAMSVSLRRLARAAATAAEALAPAPPPALASQSALLPAKTWYGSQVRWLFQANVPKAREGSTSANPSDTRVQQWLDEAFGEAHPPDVEAPAHRRPNAPSIAKATAAVDELLRTLPPLRRDRARLQAVLEHASAEGGSAAASLPRWQRLLVAVERMQDACALAALSIDQRIALTHTSVRSSAGTNFSADPAAAAVFMHASTCAHAAASHVEASAHFTPSPAVRRTDAAAAADALLGRRSSDDADASVSVAAVRWCAAASEAEHAHVS